MAALSTTRARTSGRPSISALRIAKIPGTNWRTSKRVARQRRSPGIGSSLLLEAPIRTLGRVDGFDDDEAEGESHEGSEVLVGFLTTERDALEALELADQLLDAGAVERLRKE